eukprot:m.116235 g.116235  ORF g.116235 m.116235 type:complete len:135 (-) comp13601_c0_seq4:2241-2645(-)
MNHHRHRCTIVWLPCNPPVLLHEVYDVSRKETFDHVNLWLEEAKIYCDANCIRMLVGNKIDLDRDVEEGEGRQFAREHQMLFIQASAKTSDGVDDAFTELSQKILDTPSLWKSGQTSGTANLGQTGGAQGGCCS